MGECVRAPVRSCTPVASANEQMVAAEGLGFVPYTRPTGNRCGQYSQLAVLISGSSANLQALIQVIAAGKRSAPRSNTVSSRPSAKGLQRAERAGIQTLTLSGMLLCRSHRGWQRSLRMRHRSSAAADNVGHGRLYAHRLHTPLRQRSQSRVVNLHRHCCQALPAPMRLTMRLLAASR